MITPAYPAFSLTGPQPYPELKAIQPRFNSFLHSSFLPSPSWQLMASRPYMSAQHILFPSEVWFFILKRAVSTDWSGNVFFPPADNFRLVSGFKVACRAFYALIMALPEENIRIADAGELRRNKWLRPERIRHMMIERNTSLTEYMQLMSRCEKLVSLSVSFAQREFSFLGIQLASQKLVRLDLTYEVVFWRPVTLDFPNLEELRLSSENPIERRDEPTYVPIMSVAGNRFAVALIMSLRKLQRLTHLSVHVTLDDPSVIDPIRENHLTRHRCAESVPFTQCKHCLRNYADEKDVLAREAKLSHMLASTLPALERVFWTDAWNVTFCDEEAQRESTIIRMPDGKISINVGGRKVAMQKNFSLRQSVRQWP